MEKESKLLVRTLLVFVIILIAVCFAIFGRQCSSGNGVDTISIVRDSVTDTVFIERHDTLPPLKGETIIKYVTITVEKENSDKIANNNDTASVTLPVVQKKFSDDSTYTAYVSGVKYDDMPKLDSIVVRSRIVTNTIKETITIQKKRSRFNIGLQAGYGYGFNYKGFEPYIGVGVSFNIFR